MDGFKKYLDPEYQNIMNYSDFSEEIAEDEEKILNKIKLFVNNHIKDILLINIKEDKLFLKKNEIKKLPRYIQNMLRFSENRWGQIYIFNFSENSEIWKQAMAVFGWSMWRWNDYYFKKIINDQEISKIVKKIEIKLSSILQDKQMPLP